MSTPEERMAYGMAIEAMKELLDISIEVRQSTISNEPVVSVTLLVGGEIIAEDED